MDTCVGRRNNDEIDKKIGEIAEGNRDVGQDEKWSEVIREGAFEVDEGLIRIRHNWGYGGMNVKDTCS